MTVKHKFLTMDATRGIAAICVMIFHFPWASPDFNPMPNGSIAVDFFLCLSGFVIAYSYEEKLNTGMTSLSVFFWRRLVRLYPMYLVGTLIGIVGAVAYFFSGDGNSLRAIAFAATFAFLFLPYLRSFVFHWGDIIHGNHVFPLNGPAWSLFFELSVNLLYAMKRPNWLGYATILPISFLYLAVNVFFFDTEPGWLIPNFVGGFPRAMFSFVFGTLLYIAWKSGKWRHLNLGPAVPCVLVLAMCAAPYSHIGFLSLVLIGVPLAVWLATSNPKSRMTGRFFEWLGELSYPLYAIHMPIFTLSQISYDKYTDISVQTRLPDWIGIPLMLAIIGLAMLLSRIYDIPIRRWLSAYRKGIIGTSRRTAV